MSDILYLKFDRNIEVDRQMVTLGDVGKLECSNQSVVNKLKTLKLLKIQTEKSNRYVFSVLKVIELIHREYPSLEIQNLGEADFIIDYEKQKKPNALYDFAKAALVCLISFFGAAFSIMAFNNDVGTTEVFGQLYELVMGETSDGFSMLELTYSVGLSIGILVFFNHFGGKRITNDPTPIEVEMRLYEDDVNTTLIEGCNRKETSIDVD